ncbi:MAG: hypothetical protein HOD58_06620 [Gammaproteobacteria bacterium]|nr:hypothetical protein [Gammaproteobacteria bacterium]MBT5268080.1 hypothetical protein [Candidatus Neomarinimicrobiota bacterium]
MMTALMPLDMSAGDAEKIGMGIDVNLQDKTNAELNRMVAKLQGWVDWPVKLEGNEIQNSWCLDPENIKSGDESTMLKKHYDPCTNGQQSMDLLEKYSIYLEPFWITSNNVPWIALCEKATEIDWQEADTPKRAIVMAAIAYLSEGKE